MDLKLQAQLPDSRAALPAGLHHKRTPGHTLLDILVWVLCRIVTAIVWTLGKEDKTQFLLHNVMLKVLVANLIALINPEEVSEVYIWACLPLGESVRMFPQTARF